MKTNSIDANKTKSDDNILITFKEYVHEEDVYVEEEG